MTVSNEVIDSLLAGYKKPEDLIGEHGLLKQLTKRLIERALEAEMTEHLGHGKHAEVVNPEPVRIFVCEAYYQFEKGTYYDRATYPPQAAEPGSAIHY